MALLQLNNPSALVISGPSNSGKSTFVYRVIKHSKELFTTSFKNIYYFYGVWQADFKGLQLDKLGKGVNFIEGLPTQSFIDDISPEHNNLIIIDDQQQTALNSSLIADIFTKYSHHKKLTIILVLQNLFHQGKFARDISLNTHYFILFKNQRDINQIKILGNQLGLGKHLYESYMEATKTPYSYLLVDLTPNSINEYMIRSHIFPNEHPTIYINN